MRWRARRCRRSGSCTRHWPDGQPHRSRAKAHARRFASLFWSCPSLQVREPLITSRSFDFSAGWPDDGIRPEGGVALEVPSARCPVPSDSCRVQLGTGHWELGTFLLTDAEFVDDRAVPLLIGLLEVVQ